MNPTVSVDDEWAKFILSNNDDSDEELELCHLSKEFIPNKDGSETPKSGDIYISTKSKIAYLDREIDLKEVFWKIPVIPYATPKNGVIKKQMKFNSTSQEEVDTIQDSLKDELYVDQHVITSINNPTGRIKFKDIRKISIGVSKKDIMSYRCKRKSAFYNCFVMILRIRIKNMFKEFHIKVFNTGQLEIPGIQSDEIFEEVLKNIISTLQPYVKEQLNYNQKSETVLINSNFNCGFFINREKLYDILKYNYNIQCIYDPCSYPGIQCKFYYNPNLEVQTGCPVSDDAPTGVKMNNKDKKKNKNGIKAVSFMIFRTGSILIVGMCEEYVLYNIYEFLKDLLFKEYHQIHQAGMISSDAVAAKDKKKKIRRKNIIITTTSVSSH
jgi:TATA-box binding protein (TBP) (component of TFIID and TFIIIB)